MRVLVCGGRYFSNTELVYRVLDELKSKETIDCVIEGDATGADRIAGYWAKKNRIDLKIFPANWKEHGRSAGFLRNEKMLREGSPDLIIAFPGGKGTAMMRRLAHKAGVKVVEINAD